MTMSTVKKAYLGSVLPERGQWRINLLNRLGVAIALGDAAHVDATLNLEETLITPDSSPGVLNQPVVKSRRSVISVSNGKHGMVDIIGAVLADCRIVNSSSDVREVISDLESDGNGLNVHSFLKFHLVEGSDVD